MEGDRVHRDTLYSEVWTTPMLSLASRYGVSSNFLARVCTRLNIPRPPRGYWAKRASGQKPKIPPLPKARLGDVLEWKKGDRLAITQTPETVDAATTGRKRDRHSMISMPLDDFTKGKVTGDGYLKPSKRNLADLIVTEATLTRAATVLRKLATGARDFGGHVEAACIKSGFSRMDLGDESGRLKRSMMEGPLWRPGVPTLVFINNFVFGLTIYEQTIEKEMVYVDGKYLTVNDARNLHPGLWDRKRKSLYRVSSQRVPAKRLCLRVSSPYWQVKWFKTWTEDDSRLDKQVMDILAGLHTQAENLITELDAANRKAEEERERQEEEWLIARALHERSLIEKAKELSLQNLLSTIDKWSEGQRIQAFFDDVIMSAASLPDGERAEVIAKIEQALSLLNQPDSLNSFIKWQMPPPPVAD